MTPKKFKLTFGFNADEIFKVDQNIDAKLKADVHRAKPKNLVTQEFGALTDSEGVKKHYVLLVRWRIIGYDTIRGYIESIILFFDEQESNLYLISQKNKSNGSAQMGLSKN